MTPLNLLPHQEKLLAEALPILTARYQSLALMAEIGTGKSRMLLSLYREVALYKKPPLKLVILVPKTLFPSWSRELREVWPDTNFVTWADIAHRKRIPDTPIVLVNVEAFQQQGSQSSAFKYVESLLKSGAFLALDESVKIKNPSSVRTKAILKLANLAMYRVIMSGTSASAGAEALFAQYLFLSPRFWDSAGARHKKAFERKYCILKNVYLQAGRMIETVKKPAEYSNLESAKHRQQLDDLKAYIAPFTVYCKRSDCLTLPGLQDIRIPVELNPKEARAYNDLANQKLLELEGETKLAVNGVSLFAGLRQISGGFLLLSGAALPLSDSPSKIAALTDYLEDSDEQAIVAAFFRHEIDAIEAALKPLGGASVLKGGLHPDDALAELEAHRSGRNRFLVAQHDVLAQGLNLQYCHLMVVYSKSLQAETNAQYRGRIDRLGQKDKCVVCHLVAERTVDERIEAILDANQDVASYFANLSVQEAKNLLTPV